MWDQIIEFVTTQLETNQLLAGGAVLGAIGILWSYLRNVPFTVARWSRLLFVTELNIPDKTQTFHWVTDWLAHHKYMKKARRICVQFRGQATDGNAQMSPAPGWHFLWWDHRPMFIHRVRREGTGEMANKPFRETWEITLLGSRKKVEAFIRECRAAYHVDKDQTIEIVENEDYCWKPPNQRPKRPMTSVILSGDTTKEITDDVRAFVDDEEWYRQMHIPWRRGYLLTGPPGNGKSSLVTAIASEFDFSVYIINLNTVEIEALSRMFMEIPERTILLLEDIDCVFQKREGKTMVDLSTLLNLLDGVNATEGRLLVMTTNYPERLDPALIRPGRVDKIITLNNASQRQIERLYTRFFPNARNSSDFATKVVKHHPSMATLQGYLLRYRHDIRAARASIKELSDDNGKKNIGRHLFSRSNRNSGRDRDSCDVQHDDGHDRAPPRGGIRGFALD